VFLTQQGTGIGAWLDSGQLQGAFRLAEADIVRASGVETDAKRCLTVENEAAFHELAKLQSGELLIQDELSRIRDTQAAGTTASRNGVLAFRR